MEDKRRDSVANSTDDVVESGKKSNAGKKLDKKKLVRLFSTVGLSAFFCAFYYCSMEISSRNIELYYFFPTVMFIYMAVLALLVLAYIIYNRGFSRKGVTVDMLPLEWSEEKKLQFVESGRIRLEKSKWLLIFIISFMFTFIVEAFTLFVIPMLKGFFF